ncbi:hypothetical protein V8C37DRAFT_377696 [Trichoderma ceciliae]
MALPTNIASCLECRQMWCTAPIIQGTWVYLPSEVHDQSLAPNETYSGNCLKADMLVVLAYSEREGATIYIAQEFISSGGEIVRNRLKIKRTHAERTISAEGQVEYLTTVVDLPFSRISGLNCWEHLQPLLRDFEHTQNVQNHISS